LSWERSCFGFLAVAALALVGHGPIGIGNVVVGIAGVALSLLTLWLGRLRAGRPTVAAEAEVLVLGGGTVAFGVLVVAFILW
jgi:hypothetical protein